jgi:hypothetical protein
MTNASGKKRTDWASTVIKAAMLPLPTVALAD